MEWVAVSPGFDVEVGDPVKQAWKGKKKPQLYDGVIKAVGAGIVTIRYPNRTVSRETRESRCDRGSHHCVTGEHVQRGRPGYPSMRVC